MRQKLKFYFSILTIILLLPYIITLFLNGSALTSSPGVDDTYIKVRVKNQVSDVSLTEYCLGILAKEISMDSASAAIEAQAVLVRTDTYRKLQTDGKETVFTEAFLSADDMRHQWGEVNFPSYYQKLCDAWEETEGEVLIYNEALAYAPYHLLNNGSTRVGQEVLKNDSCPYLQMRECPADLEAEQQLKTTTIDIENPADTEVTAYDSAGYVTSVRIGDKVYSGEEFRNQYELPSSCFTLQEYEGKLRVTTKGAGHGLGMSQYSANKMAEQGQSRQEILGYFFEGIEIREVAEII